jgi:hypothetical protein
MCLRKTCTRVFLTSAVYICTLKGFTEIQQNPQTPIVQFRMFSLKKYIAHIPFDIQKRGKGTFVLP